MTAFLLLLPGPHIHVLIPEALIPSLSPDSAEWSGGRDRILSTCSAWQIPITKHVLRVEFHTEEVDPLTPPVLFLLSGYTCPSPPLIFCHLLSSTVSWVEQFSPLNTTQSYEIPLLPSCKQLHPQANGATGRITGLMDGRWTPSLSPRPGPDEGQKGSCHTARVRACSLSPTCDFHPGTQRSSQELMQVDSVSSKAPSYSEECILHLAAGNPLNSILFFLSFCPSTFYLDWEYSMVNKYLVNLSDSSWF